MSRTVDDEKLIKGAIDGMLASLDPHSTYLDGADLQRSETMIDGNYSGLGLSVAMDDGAVKVISPMRGSPAESAGVKAGDYITHLDGKLIYGGELDDAVAQMRGEAGTKIRLTLFRPGRDEPFDVTVTRGVIELEPVTWKLEARSARDQRQRILARCRPACRRGHRGLRKQAGGKLTGLVLDLRSNPGGSLDEAVALSDLFLTSGDIVSQRGRNAATTSITAPNRCSRRCRQGAAGDRADRFRQRPRPRKSSRARLQDQRRAVVMGERSFGKGGPVAVPARQGTSAVKLTTARYFTPAGHSVQEGGIEPDIKVPQLSDPDARRAANWPCAKATCAAT
jgi:carboxyl-terminal processing protease